MLLKCVYTNGTISLEVTANTYSKVFKIFQNTPFGKCGTVHSCNMLVLHFIEVLAS